MAIIDKPTDYFNTKIYSGSGSSPNALTGVGFQPDFTWFKKRNAIASHFLYDSIRGVSKSLNSDDAGAEGTNGYLSSFDTDGFTLGSTSANINASGGTYASWNWKAGTSFTNDASATGIGTIDSTGSFNNTSGFSIVKFTGTGANGTIKHGLNVAPKVIIQKGLDAALNWKVYHSSLGAGKYINFDETAAAVSATVTWNNTAPTSSVFSVGSGNNNNSSQAYIAYCFADTSMSKMESYVGTNGGADGPFIYTGFKPAFVLIKNSSAVADWNIRDDKRNTYNPATNFLVPDSDAAEVTAGEAVDILSNGFKIKANGGKVQDSGNTYIYMAFAENPFVTSTGVPATAR